MTRRSAADRKAEAARHRQMTEEAIKSMSNIPTISLQLCEYDKANKILRLPSEYYGMPNEFFLKSHHTDKVVRFKVIDQYDLLFDPDGWDGEICIYRPFGNVPKVDHLVIYHAW